MLKFSKYILKESIIDIEDLVLPDLMAEEKISDFWFKINDNVEKKFQTIKDEVNSHIQHSIENLLMQAGFEIVTSDIIVKSWLTQFAKLDGLIEFTYNNRSFYIKMQEDQYGLFYGNINGIHHYIFSEYSLKRIIDTVKNYQD